MHTRRPLMRVLPFALFLAAIHVILLPNLAGAAEPAGASPASATQHTDHSSSTSPNHEVGLYIFLLAGFLGYHIITRVPPLLHTPLMSATNAISGISLIGSLVVAGSLHDWLSTTLGFIAVGCSSVNVVGGFLITDRMLKMFKSERDAEIGRAHV